MVNNCTCVDKPEIIGLPSELTANEGGTFTFPSHVTGKPLPDVYWYLNFRYVANVIHREYLIEIY